MFMCVWNIVIFYAVINEITSALHAMCTRALTNTSGTRATLADSRWHSFTELIYFTEVPTVDVDFYLAQTYITKPVKNILVTKSFIAIK